MRRPEPLPAFPPTLSGPQSGPFFTRVDEVNGAVITIIHSLSANGQYTGVGSVQSELFRRFPNCLSFIQRIGLYPDNIPAIVEHRRLIQSVNSLLWAYATTHNVLTLCDLEDLLQTEYRDSARYLGPIYTLPVAQELCEVTTFHPRVCEAFSGGTVDTVYRITTERLFEELNQFVCQNRYRLPSSQARQINRWWESLFTQHMLRLFGEQDVPRNATELTFSRLGVYGIRIKQFAKLIESIVEMLRPENLSRAAKLMQELLDTEVRRAYEKFAETTVSEEAIARLRRQKPVKALRTLANNCVNLHNNLMEWAEQMHLSWPPGFLKNLLSFQKFLDGIATAGPFRSLLHLALVYSKSEGISVRELLPKVQQNVVINLADDDEEEEEEEVKADPVDADAAECQFVIDRQGNLSDTDSSEKLSNAVERFNRFIESLTVGLKPALGSLEGPPLRGLPWQLLRQFEKNLLQDLHWRKKTLLTVLADACDSDSNVAKPVYLFPKSFVNENSTPANGAATQAASAIQQDAATESAANSAKDSVVAEADNTDTVKVQAVRNFVLRLTCLLERSLEAIVGLVACELKTAESTDLLNTVQCFLAESVVNGLEPPRLSYLFHPMDFSFLGSKQTSREAVTCGMLQSKFAQELVTQRSAVLGLLATCPPMLDPEQWTLWSYPGFLAQRWGELEEFMLNCSALEVCDKFNLIVLKLSSGGYLRLSANATSKTIEKTFLSWQQQQQQEGTTKSPSSLRGLCDALVGSAFAINRLSAEEAVTALASRLKNAADCQLWVQLVLDILLIVPLSLLGLLFGKVILPALDEAGLRDKNAWAADRRDFQAPSSSTSTTAGGSVGLLDLLLSETPAGGARHCRRQHLITAVGALGSQLGWPAWVDFYQCHRYISTAAAAPVDVALPKSVEPRVVDTTITTEAKQTPPPSWETSPSREPMELPNASSNEEETSIIQTGLTSSRREFVENLRRSEYGRGVELDETANKLLQLYERRLSRSLAHLSQELYGQPGHFLLELIQNADDNTYADDRGSNNDGGSVPSIEFYLYTADDSTTTSATLFVRNNEAAGFSEADISALCDVGVSTKMAQRDQKTGRKGIGFKSVFSVTDGPEVHSAGFHVRFQRPHTSAEKDQQQLGSILVPEWINPLFAPTAVPRIASADGGSGGGINLSPSSLEPAGPWKTVFRLPLSGSRPSSTATGVCEFARELICPHVMLFLRRLKNITFAYISSGPTDKQASIFDYRRLVKTSKRLFSPVGESSSYLELVTIEETCLASPNSEVLPPIPTVTKKHQWLVFTRKFWVDPDQLRRLGCHSKVTLKHTSISIGINLSDTFPPTEYPVYAFLPVRSAGFSFLLNADFDLTSSREDVDGTSVWNRWLVGQLPAVFENLLQAIAEASPSQLQSMAVADLSQHVLLGRILNCLPLGAGSGAGKKSAASGVTAAAVRGTPSSIFSGVGEQLRDRLSRVVWIPVKPTDTADAEAAGFAAPRQVLFLPNSLFQSGKTASPTPSRPKFVQKAVTSATSPDNFLIRLLIERLGMLELDPTFLVEHPIDGCIAATDTDATAEDVSRIEHGLEKLLALGVQTVSAESLLELASILSPDELKRSGVLLALIGNIENSFRSYGDLHQSLLQVAVSNHTNRRRRCCLALRHLAIFPLTDGRLVSLSEIEAASAPAAAADSSISVVSQNRLLLPPPPPPPSSSSGSTENPSGDSEEIYGAYVSLLSRLGPLVSPFSIYPSMSHETAALPQLFTEPTSRDGLGLAIAFPEVVLRQWIVPRLASMATAPSTSASPANDSDWFISAAQFVVWCSTQLHVAHPSPLLLSATTKSDVSTSTLNDLTGLLQGLPTQFPLLASNCVHSEPVTVVDTDAAEAIPSTAASLQPALCSLPEGVRSTPLFVQPFLLCQQQSDSAEEGSLDTEADLMRLCLSGEQASKATLVSSCYFCSGRTCLETLGLLSSAALAHWLEFFVQAGASTLQSLHRKQYRYGDSPVHLPALPSDHVLMAPLMKVLGGAVEPGTSWIVEDTVCPGLDTLLLPWIERTADACSSSAVMTTCSKLADLLNSNWPNFERSKLALYHQHADENASPGLRSASVQNRCRSYEFAAASWLVNLRVCEWLPVAQSRDVPAVRRRLEEMRAKDTLQGAASRPPPPPPPADSVPSSIEDLHLASSSKFDLARAAEPCLRSHIYAPTAFAPVGLGHLDSRSPELTALLRALCPVWQSSVVVGDAAASPPCVNFIEALGLRTRLDEAAFEHFMDFLATSCEGLFAPSFLTPSLLLRTYELLKQFASDHHAPAVVPHGSGVSKSAAPRNEDWLRGLLVPPSSRTVLVPCLLSARHSGKRPRGSGPARPERCPACLRLETYTTAAAEPGSSLGGRPPWKRRHSAIGRGDAVSAQQEGEEEEEGESAPRYHLVPASWTCWQRVCLPEFAPTELTQGETNDEDDDDAGDEEDPDFEESNPTPALVIHGEGQQDDQSTLPPEDVSDERVPLCDTYGSEWQGFFCITLQVPATSSVAEVLRLRPTPPSGTLSDASYRRAQKHFGQRLGAWYSLLQFCISSENLTPAEIEASLFDVPLLYDLSGRWRTRNSGRLFAWSTPDLAGLFIRAAPAGSDQLLGHSLPALDASASSPMQVCIGSATRFRNPGTLVGTTNAFLLDVLRLPLLDQVASLGVGLFEVPSQAGMIPGFAVPCAPLDAVLKAFRQLAQAWLAAPTRSTSLKPSSFLKTVPLGRVEAYFVPDLTLTLTINLPGQSERGSDKWTIPNIACRLVNNKLYMDSRFGEHVFADFVAAAATAPENCAGAAASPLARLHSALTRIDTATNELNEGGVRVESIQQMLLAELSRALLPTNRSSQLALIHFVRGFLNVTTPLLEQPSRPDGRRQLHAYMLSHGIPRSQASHLLNSLLPPGAPQPSSSSSVQRPAPPTVETAASLLTAAPTTSVVNAGGAAGAAFVAPQKLEPISQRNLSAPRSIRVSQLTAATRGTRYQTLLSEAFSSGASNSQSRSTEEKEAEGTTASSESFWRGITDGSDSSALSAFTREKLSRALSSGGSSASAAEIGRMGEMAVFQYLQQAIRHSRQDAHLTFPSGHPNLGPGRLVDCRWVNADSESRLPYDITVTLEVECSQDRWHPLLNSLSQEVARRYVTVSRTPSHDSSGLLTVGPLYLEVKSTAALDDQSSRLDIFEFSLSEAVFAHDNGWRYHLVRVHWSRRQESSAPVPVLTHVPNLSDTLFAASGLRMCLAMAMPQQATTTTSD